MSVSINKTPDFISLSSFPQAVAHVDCDAFFASCEQARNPLLKGKPVITGKERGIVSCASYEAKARGIERATRLGEVKKLCPEAVILPSDYELYSIYSARLFEIIRRFTPEVEEYSIDEAFCDLTGLRRLYRTSYEEIAFRIKNSIQKELDITVSVGLSLSKTLAKICSKHNKPDGFTVLPGDELHLFLKDIALRRVCGFGPNTVALLEKQGIRSVLDYIRRPKEFAQGLLGKIGLELWHELRGFKVYPVNKEVKESYQTISKTKTFSPASDKREFVKAELMRNLESACIKLRRHGLSSRSLTIFLKKIDFSSSALEGCINRHSASTLDFTRVCAGLFDELYEARVFYRATGVILSDILKEGNDAKDLFEDPVRIERLRRVSEAADKINLVYGKHALHLASTEPLKSKQPHPRNSACLRKTELLKGETFRKRLGLPLLKIVP